ncbi:MAG: hypothetical protein IT243_01600 [Bacteroidia bacterium]|nr:hypothetical protein [Bacteroidia bacterium]
MIEGISKSELVLLKFTLPQTQSSLNWEHSKEFEYNGQMYDVVEKKFKGDTIYYWCWADNKETKLNKQLDKLLLHALGCNTNNKENQKRLSNFYKSLFFEKFSIITQFYPPNKNKQKSICFINYISLSSQPKVPPPELS